MASHSNPTLANRAIFLVQSLLCWLLLLQSSLGHAAAQEPRRWQLDAPIPVLSSIATIDSETVVVTDALHRRIFEIGLEDIDARGTSLPVRELGVSEDPSEFPMVLHRAEDNRGLLRIVGQFAGSDFRIGWNTDGGLEGGIEHTELAVDGGSRSVLGLYDFTVAADHLVAFGAIDSGLGNYGQAAFFSHDLRTTGLAGEPTSGRMLMPLESVDLYLLGYPTMTSNRGTSFFLRLDRYAELFRVDPRSDVSPRPMEGFPFSDEELPALTEGGALDSLEALRLAEEASMPAGLYSDNRLLYLLHRRPSKTEPGSATLWTLHALEPLRDRVREVGEVRLPTEAAHLRLMTGLDGRWLAFEQDSIEIERDGDRLLGWSMPTRTVLEIPTAWLATHFDPTARPLESQTAALDHR